jgi:hypothetical protein
MRWCKRATVSEGGAGHGADPGARPPSGDPKPSRQNYEVTREIQQAAGLLGVVVHDHVIVGNGRCFSFRGEGLLGPHAIGAG